MAFELRAALSEKSKLHNNNGDAHKELIEISLQLGMWPDAQRIAVKYGIDDISVALANTSSPVKGTSLLRGLKTAMKVEAMRQNDEAISQSRC